MNMPGLIPGVIVALGLSAASGLAAERYDVIIRHGRVVDGTGAPWYLADVAIQEGRIAKIGPLENATAAVEIEARGLIVAPGFIDMMGQNATGFLTDPAIATNLLAQGITTINAGEGESAAPLVGEQAQKAGWSSFAEYFARLEKAGMPLNIVQTVGHTQVRKAVLGEVDRRPLPAELEQMRQLVRESMQAGTIGVSTALIYPPAVYATTEEIVELVKVAGEFHGGYYTHMRNEGNQLLEAIEEAIEIGQKAGTRVHIFHLKAAGEQNWPKMEQAIARIKTARAAGHQVAADIYPYVFNGLGIAAFIHPRHAAEGHAQLKRKLDDPALRTEIRQEMETRDDYENWYRHTGRNWDRVFLGGLGGTKLDKFGGRSIAFIARELSQDPWDIFFETCRLDAMALPQTMPEANVIRAMREEFVSFCTDAGPASDPGLASHPRAYGAYPRILGRYVRDLGVLSVERAVSKMSALAANEILQYDRGRLATGLAADLAIFNPQTITDRADLTDPHALAEGMQYVLVNGQVVFKEGKYTGAKPGRVLRGPGYQPAR